MTTPEFRQAVADVKATRIEIEGRWLQQSKALLTKMRRPITCRKGCDHCCHHPVLISFFEGILLYRHLKKERLWTSTLRNRLQEASNKVNGLDYKVWLLSAVPCPLLRDNKCSAYKGRPLRCRMMSSIDDPTLCHPHRFDASVEILPSAPVLKTFYALERELLWRHSMPYVHLPLGQAVLLGSKIEEGDLQLLDLMGLMLKQFTEAHFGNL